MKLNPEYSLYYIAGVPYLLPHGQGIADHRRGVRLNETSVFLWNALQEGLDRPALLARMAAHFEGIPERSALLEQDLDTFLDTLSSLGILSPMLSDRSEDTVPFACMHLRIGPLNVQLIGPPEAFSEEFLPFRSDPDAATYMDDALTVMLMLAPAGSHPKNAPLIRHLQLCLYQVPGYYLLEFPQAPQITEVLLTMDGRAAYVYHNPPYGSAFATDLFHAIRMLYLYAAQLHGCYALHSASILYRGKAWLFSGHSGMGKSTHVALWQELYQVPVLNGDLNLLSLKNGSPVIFGIPWCGTSHIADPARYPLGGIILLDQAPYDECIPLSADQQILLAAQRLISPAWTPDMLHRNLDFMEKLVPHIGVCLLKCTKEPSAVHTIKNWIDTNVKE